MAVRIPSGPAPTHLVVEDLRKGTGPVVRSLNDKIDVRYVVLEFSGHKASFDNLGTRGTSTFILHETHPGWEIGLKGMRQGGLRKLITPPRFEYGTTTLVYVIEMVKVRHSQS
jgi:peptidylprolyl isomerase